MTPLREKRAKVRSHMTPLRRKAREGEESPDALGASYQLPDFADYYASCLRPFTWCSTRSYSSQPVVITAAIL